MAERSNLAGMIASTCGGSPRYRLARGRWLACTVLYALTLAGLASAGLAPTAAAQGVSDANSALGSAQAVLDCVAANAPSNSFSQIVEFVTRDAGGSEREQRAKMFGHAEDGDLALTLQVTDPIDVADTAVLIRRRKRDTDYQDDQYVYLPSLQRSRRVVGGMAESPMLGTDLSYSDVARFFGAFSGAQASLITGAPPGEAHVRVIPESTGNGASDIAALVVHVERMLCVPLRVELLDVNGQISKTIVADRDSISAYGERHMAHRFTITTEQTQSTTTVELSRVKLDPSLSSGLFHPRSYYRAR